VTIGRNDPCPCCSGKKYKKCYMPQAEVISLQAYREAQAHRRLLDDLDRYIAFSYRSPVDGLTMCQRFEAQAEGLDSGALAMLHAWASPAPGFFRVTQLELQAVLLSRLPDDRQYVVSASGTGLKVGELVEAWLLPVPPGWRFGLARIAHSAGLAAPLTHLLHVEIALLQRQERKAPWDQLYRQCGPRLTDAVTLSGVHGEAVSRIEAPPGPAVLVDGGGTELTDPKWNAVAQLLTRQLAAEQLHPGQIRGALRLCHDVAAVIGPRSGKPEGWAAGLYYLFRLDIQFIDITQAEAGDVFGLSQGVVGTRARAVMDALGVHPLDPRYVDLMDPLTRSLWRLDAIETMEGAMRRTSVGGVFLGAG